jgi:hypothetical protein
VRAANPTLKTSEIGALLGQQWKELPQTTRDRYNDEFKRDMVEYNRLLDVYKARLPPKKISVHEEACEQSESEEEAKTVKPKAPKRTKRPAPKA